MTFDFAQDVVFEAAGRCASRARARAFLRYRGDVRGCFRAREVPRRRIRPGASPENLRATANGASACARARACREGRRSPHRDHAHVGHSRRHGPAGAAARPARRCARLSLAWRRRRGHRGRFAARCGAQSSRRAARRRRALLCALRLLAGASRRISQCRGRWSAIAFWGSNSSPARSPTRRAA